MKPYIVLDITKFSETYASLRMEATDLYETLVTIWDDRIQYSACMLPVLNVLRVADSRQGNKIEGLKVVYT
jgi:hypothetical protein